MPKPILVLVESPSKCHKIERYLGPGYKVIATYGHIMKLNSLENIEILNNFNCNYDLITDRAKNIELIRQYINDVPQVILACDNDREGEAICASICRLFHLPIETTKRIIFTEITETAIQYAIRNPITINMNLVNAQQAREVLDILVGFTISPILWTNITRRNKTSLSAGRCQTPALRLVYDNYLEIKNSSSILKYKIFGTFTNLNLKFELNNEFEDKEEVKNFLELSKVFEFIYKGTSSIETKRSPPEPFSTSRMQQIASNNLNLSPKDTMKYAQELYENGYITYMRTDCKKYSEEFIHLVTRYIVTTYSQEYLRENLNEYIKPINSDDPHEAIRPVNISVTKSQLENSSSGNGLSLKAIKLYELIWENTIQSCMSHSTYNIITCVISAPKDNEFRYKIENNIFLGWETILLTVGDKRSDRDHSSLPKKNDTNINYYIQNLRINSLMPYKKIESEFIMRGKKSHLSEALLVNLLEEKGIGRPSTFASLIDKIQFRNYIEKKDIEGIEIKNYNYKLKQNISVIEENEVLIICGNEKNKLVITPLGLIVIEFIIEKMEELFNYEYTKNMELELDLIASGNKVWQTLCQTCYDNLGQITRNVSNVQSFSIKIDDNHSLIMGKYGPVIKVTNKYGKFSNFLKVRDDLDLDELRSREKITLEDVIENNTASQSEINSAPIGKYKGQDLYVKKGKYGIYAQWGDERKSLKEEFSNINNIKYLDVLKYLEKDNLLDKNKPPGFVRELTENISIRNGKWGDYIYYKKPRVKNPIFIPLKDFNENHRTCDKQILLNWLKIHHGVKF
jgi:DNA topoisomerase-1